MLISAQEAARRLGIKPATLYAYVSRGLLRSTATPGSRERRYHAEDVERLKRDRRLGLDRAPPPAAYDVQTPVLDSAISLVEAGHFYYRGLDALRLSEHGTLEDAARILWGQTVGSDVPAEGLPGELERWLLDLPPPAAAIERARLVLVRAAAEDLAAVDTEPAAVARTGVRILRLLAASVTGIIPGEMPVHRAMAAAWHQGAAAADLIRRCLVLIADHELNPSTYVARCVASTAATPYAVVLAALEALSGPRHGGAVARTEAMLRELLESEDPAATFAERLRRAEPLSGFGQPLYPEGDPRAVAVFRALVGVAAPARSRALSAMTRAAERMAQRKINVDFALGAVAASLGLPPGAALGIFLVGRTVGWIAHAIEQYSSGQLIRPRSRYVGPLPDPDGGSPSEPSVVIGGERD